MQQRDKQGSQGDQSNYDTPRSPRRSTRGLEPPNMKERQAAITRSPRRRNLNTIFSDRYIPNRTGVDLQAAFSLSSQDILPEVKNREERIDNEIDIRKEEEANQTFSTILKAELFGDNVPMAAAGLGSLKNLGSLTQSGTGVVGSDIAGGTGSSSSSRNGDSAGTVDDQGSGSSLLRTPPRHSAASAMAVNSMSLGSNQDSSDNVTSTPRQRANLFTYQSPKKNRPRSRDLQSELYSLSPVRQDSQKLLLSPQKKPRSISKVPYRVLDAPELLDDFYLNLLDWGLQDILAVGLGSSVYLWDGSTQAVDRLCNLPNKDKVTSISWIGSGTHLSVGTQRGLVEIWDATKLKCVRTMTGHNLRTSSLAWNEHILSSGSRDRSILNRDVRIENHYVNRFEAHKQEVCGLRWNVEENKLASGGNDNKLFVWDGLNTKPLHQFNDHIAAVKAISWSPHQRGVLASGGGTADKTIKTWNTISGNLTNNVHAGSQVCNLIWSRNSNEIVSTHGFSHNQIVVWKYPSMQQIAQLTGHTYRVLYLSLSPDGETIVTGAGDETLRFWNVFEKNKHDMPSESVLLDAFNQLR